MNATNVNENDLPIIGILTIHELLAIIKEKLMKLDVKIQPKTELKIRGIIAIIGSRKPLKPIRPCEIISDTFGTTFKFGKYPENEVRYLLNYLLLAKVIKEVYIDKVPRYWLLYKIKENYDSNNTEDVFDIWRRYCKLHSFCHDCMIPESSKGIIETLTKIRICAGQMQLNPSIELQNDNKKMYYNYLNYIIRDAEKLERIYYNFYDSGELSNNEEIANTELHKSMIDLQNFLYTIKSRKEDIYEDTK